MAGVKISALTAASAAAAANELAINEAGTSKKLTVAQIKTYTSLAPVWAAGTASADTWPKFTAGTLLTTPEEGAIELDADNFYATADAGNRGILQAVHYIRAPGDQTLTSSTTAQNLFDSPANGTITLETGAYEFDCLCQITGMSATSGNGQILFAGTGTFTDWNWMIQGLDNSAPTTIADDDAAYFLTNASAASAVVAGTGTAMRFHLRGFVECSGAGTLIPQIDLVTAAAAVVEAGSCFKIWRIGAQATASVGQWS